MKKDNSIIEDVFFDNIVVFYNDLKAIKDNLVNNHLLCDFSIEHDSHLNVKLKVKVNLRTYNIENLSESFFPNSCHNNLKSLKKFITNGKFNNSQMKVFQLLLENDLIFKKNSLDEIVKNIINKNKDIENQDVLIQWQRYLLSKSLDTNSHLEKMVYKI